VGAKEVFLSSHSPSPSGVNRSEIEFQSVAHAHPIQFLCHKSINATSFIKFNPPLLSSLVKEDEGRNMAGKSSCLRHAVGNFSSSLLLLPCQSNIVSKYPSYQSEYQHVPQQQRSLLLRTHRKITSVHLDAIRRLLPYAQKGETERRGVINVLAKRKKLHFSPPFRVCIKDVVIEKVFYTNLRYFPAAMFHQIFHFLLKLIQKARGGKKEKLRSRQQLLGYLATHFLL
jgi:hypothetical protein